MLDRFRRGLRVFLRAPLSLAEAKQALESYVASRERRFLDLLEAAVYRQSRSPWLELLRHAQIELGDIRQLIQRDGIESTLGKLHGAGVYLTAGEARGKEPVIRNGTEIHLRPEDLDNPVLPGSFPALTSGSSGPRRRLLIDFALLEHDVRAHRLFLQAYDLEHRPLAIWRPVPPGAAGLKHVIQHARLGVPAEKWFSQTDPSLRAGPTKSWLFLRTALATARSSGRLVPPPEYLPLGGAAVIAEWLAARRREGTGAHLDTMVSSAIRVCQAARERGLDIAGTFFRVGGESLTESRAEVLRSAGASFACNYSMSETGPIGVACASAAEADAVHLLSGKIAILTKPGPDGRNALLLTTLLASAPRILLNVESGDSAIIENRSCGCPFGALGYCTHLHTIRSYEKVSGEGVYFLGAEFAALVEDFLPRSFGGAPTDYQFVHERHGEFHRVRLMISAQVGDLEVPDVREAVLKRLAVASRGDEMKSKIWASGDVLVVERGEPMATPGSKIPAVRFDGR